MAASPGIAALVPAWIVAEVVRYAIDLNRNTRRLAEEVENEWSERMLTPELQAVGT